MSRYCSGIALLLAILMPLKADAEWKSRCPVFRPMPPPKAHEILCYQVQGFRLWSYSFIEIQIFEDHTADVAFARGFGNAGSTLAAERVTLLPAQYTRLVGSIEESRFFSLPPKDSEFATDQGNSSLRITLGGKTRELDFVYRSALGSVTGLLRELADQVSALSGVRKGVPHLDLSHLLSNSRPKGILFEYSEFRDLMAKRLMALEDPGEERETIESLALVTSPKEWKDSVHAFLGALPEERGTALLDILSRIPISLSPEHAKACGILGMLFIQEAERRWSQVDRNRLSSYSSLLRTGLDGSPAGLPSLVPLLRSPHEEIRIIACDTITSALRLFEYCLQHKEEVEQSGGTVPVVSVDELKKELMPTLREIADGSSDVQCLSLRAKNAADALERVATLCSDHGRGLDTRIFR